MMLDETYKLAWQAFAFIATSEQNLVRFLEHSGVTPQTMRADLQKAETMAAILDFILADEALLLEFCATQNIAPDIVWKHRRHLPGAPHDQC